MGGPGRHILRCRPGITGLWQISGRTEVAFDGRLALESWYVRNWSLWLDVTILLRTLPAVIGRRGAH
jgi:undecaprenyl-phosphate galactose phosphotransferase